MLAKIWKKLALFILIIACLFNVTSKLIRKTSFLDELKSTAQYIYEENLKKENK